MHTFGGDEVNVTTTFRRLHVHNLHKDKNPLLDHKKSYFSRITRNFDVTYSVIGSQKEGNQFL